jgi:threonine synthase
MLLGSKVVKHMSYQGIIHKYKQFLPVSEDTPVVSLQEGNTPLLFSTSIGPRYGVDLYFKLEGLNPTGSFKDRGMALAISKALEEEAPMVLCASTGNTSAAAAAYAARAAIDCTVLIPEGRIALGKLAQALIHGCKVLAVEGTFDEALQIAKQLTERYPISLVNSINCYRLEGQKTAAFEICDRLKEAPDYLAIPVGNAGNITAYWLGFNQYKEAGKISNLPKMVGFQAEGAAPLVLGHMVKNPQTVASAIRIGNPARGEEAKEAAKDSGGFIDMVSDEEILATYKEVADKEGYFCEPASAACIAGLIKSVNNGKIKQGSTVVCVLTGHGLKDPDTAIKATGNVVKIKPTFEEAQKVLFK